MLSSALEVARALDVVRRKAAAPVGLVGSVGKAGGDGDGEEDDGEDEDYGGHCVVEDRCFTVRNRGGVLGVTTAIQNVECV